MCRMARRLQRNKTDNIPRRITFTSVQSVMSKSKTDVLVDIVYQRLNLELKYLYTHILVDVKHFIQSPQNPQKR
jgi:hypothetical protein